MFVKGRGRGGYQKEVDRQNIMLNDPKTISHTSDEEMKHAHSSNDDGYLSDECQSINVTIKHYHFVQCM